jgi:hypothetical protein
MLDDAPIEVRDALRVEADGSFSAFTWPWWGCGDRARQPHSKSEGSTCDTTNCFSSPVIHRDFAYSIGALA